MAIEYGTKVTTKVRLVGGYKPSWARGAHYRDGDQTVEVLIPAGSFCEIWAGRECGEWGQVYDLATVVNGDRIVVKGVVPEAFEVDA